MTIRNTILDNILTAEGGTPGVNDAMDVILGKIVLEVGGTITNPNVRNDLLNDYLVAKGGTRLADGVVRNKILEAILTEVGGSFTADEQRNPLLILWEGAIQPTGNLADPWDDSEIWNDNLTWSEA